MTPSYEVDPLDADAEISSSGIDFERIYAIVRRNLLLIIGTLAVAIVLGVIVTMLTTPRYTAVASVQIDQQADRVLTTEDVQPTVGAQDAERFLQTQVDILKSRSMAERVARRLRLFDSEAFFETMNEEPPKFVPSASQASREQQHRNAVLALIDENLRVNLPRNSRVATISFESPDPLLSARIANTFAEEFIASNLTRRYDSSSYARTFLSQQLAEAQEQLERSERALNDYARRANLIDTGAAEDGTGGARSVVTASLVQLNQAANTARSQRIIAEERWRAVESAPLLSVPEVLANSAVQVLLQQQAQVVAKLEDERTRYREEHPTVQQLEAQRVALDRQINGIASSIRRSIEDNYRAALRQDEALQRQVAQLADERLAEQDRSVQYNILARDADTNRSLYEGLLQRFREVSAAAGVATNNISIVDRAEPPALPSSPKLFFNLALALAGGMAVAALIVLAREQLDDAVRTPDDLPRKLDLAMLGAIPLLKESSPVAALEDRHSAFAEAYSALLTSLQYSSPDGLPQTLFVTSSQEAEGKSTTAYALASGLARLGRRVLLMDLDFRRPSLHHILDVVNDRGMSTILSGQGRLAEHVRTNEGDPFFYLLAGPIPPNPTELLGGSSLLGVVSEASELYDVVVFDGPPVLGLADATILAATAQATIFVVESNRKRRGATKNALRRLRGVHANLLGGVLTKFDPQKVGASQSYGY